jgi:hypothetical protein
MNGLGRSRGVSLGVSFSRQIPASLFRESGMDARFSLESRHFDGLGPLSQVSLDGRCVTKGSLEDLFQAGSRSKQFEVSWEEHCPLV